MTNTIKKPTKKTHLNVISDLVGYAESNGVNFSAEGVTYDTIREFIDHELELLESKAAAAAKRAASKRQAGDELREKVFGVLDTEQFMTINEIVKALDDPDISAQMVTARLTQLVAPEVNRVEKTSMTVPAATEGGKSRKVSAYRAL